MKDLSVLGMSNYLEIDMHFLETEFVNSYNDSGLFFPFLSLPERKI
jgi:hypothetical protein